MVPMTNVSTQHRIDTNNQQQLQQWCNKLDCKPEHLLYCVMKVGNSSQAVGDFWYMNKDRLEMFFQQIWEEVRMN